MKPVKELGGDHGFLSLHFWASPLPFSHPRRANRWKAASFQPEPCGLEPVRSPLFASEQVSDEGHDIEGGVPPIIHLRAKEQKEFQGWSSAVWLPCAPKSTGTPCPCPSIELRDGAVLLLVVVRLDVAGMGRFLEFEVHGELVGRQLMNARIASTGAVERPERTVPHRLLLLLVSPLSSVVQRCGSSISQRARDPFDNRVD